MQTPEGIAALVPRRLWSAGHDQGTRVCKGTILFADIAGFTRLTETAMRRAGTRGIEHLTSQINAIFSDLVDAAHQSGGDILKFGGDAILVAYDFVESDQQCVSAAIDSASAMQQVMIRHRRTTLRALSLHLGLAHGEWYECVAGIQGTRREHFVWGKAIVRAMHAADTGGDRARLDCPVSLLPKVPAYQFKRVGRQLFEFTPQESRNPVRGSWEDESIPATAELWDLIPESLRDEYRISTLGTHGSAEHRRVTTVFGFWTCHRELNNQHKSAILLDQVFHIVHESAHAGDGLWARSDPSGEKQKLLILFGATQSRVDDADRALTVARMLRQRFSELRRDHSSLRLGIGVATATVFTGFVGHIHRREFTAMGDGVNLSARLAAKAMRHAILVDEATRVESTRFRFRDAGTLLLKNVRKPTPIFVPTGEADVLSNDAHNAIIEHPGAMSECVKLWDSGATHIRLLARPGADAHKFVAQLLTRIEHAGQEHRFITFDPSDASHPLGGIRRLCRAIMPSRDSNLKQQSSSVLVDMFGDDGRWAARMLPRRGPDATAFAVIEELARLSIPRALFVLDHTEVLGELDRLIFATMVTRQGPRWLAIDHGELTSPNAAPAAPADSVVSLGAICRDELLQAVQEMLSPARPSRSLVDFLFSRAHGMVRMASSLLFHLVAQGAVTRSGGRHGVWQLRSTDNLDIPNGLRATYLQQVDRLPRRDQLTLRAVAVIGDAAPLRAVHSLCKETSEASLIACFDRLQSRGLLAVHSDGREVRVTINDPSCRQAVYETMSHQLRESWHRAAAEHWRAETVADHARIGEHLFRSRDPQSAIWLRHAARQARQFWSLDRSRLYTRWAILALQQRCNPEYSAVCPPMPAVLPKQQEALYDMLAEILQLQGQHSDSGRIHRLLALHATRENDQRRAIRHRLSAARMDLYAGHYEKSQRQARSALKVSRRLGDQTLRAQAAFLLGENCRRSGRVGASLKALKEAELLLRRKCDRDLYADVLNALGLLHWNCGRLDDARSCFEASLRSLGRRGDHARRGQVANNLGILNEEQGKLPQAERYYEKSFTVFDRTGLRRHRAYSLGNLGNLHRHAARYERARSSYEEVETELRGMGEAHAAAYTIGNIGDLERDFGDFASARLRYDVTLEFAIKAGDEELKAECYARIAHLHLLTGRLELMPRLIHNSRRAAKRAASREFSLYAQLLSAEKELAKGSSQAARRCLAIAAAEVVQVGLVYYQLWANHALARLEIIDGEIQMARLRQRSGMVKARTCRYRWWELRFAALGADQNMSSASRVRCQRRCVGLIREIEAGIGDASVRTRFLTLPIVHDILERSGNVRIPDDQMKR